MSEKEKKAETKTPVEKFVKLNLTPIVEVPQKQFAKTREWLEVLKRIPRGQAWNTTEDELGITVSSMRISVQRYIKGGLLPKDFKVIQRTVGGILRVYIMNGAKTEK